jgi:hypothetical protein
MREVVVLVTGAVVWLVLLEATGFSSITMGLGVLVALELLSRTRRATR